MPYRPRNDVPRLSGRPETPADSPPREGATVFRRFFDLIERLERPAAGHPPAGKASRPVKGGRK